MAGCTRWPRLSRLERRFTYPLRFLYALFSLHAGTTAAVPVHLLGTPDKTLAWLPSGGHPCLIQAWHQPCMPPAIWPNICPRSAAAQQTDGQRQHFPSRGIAAKD